MVVKLVSKESKYEYGHKLEDEPKDAWPVFSLKYLSAEEVMQIDDAIVVSAKDREDGFSYLGGTAVRMKIDAALVDWKNVFDEKGNQVPCTTQNKLRLPSAIATALVKNIDEVNGLVKTREKREYEKN